MKTSTFSFRIPPTLSFAILACFMAVGARAELPDSTDDAQDDGRLRAAIFPAPEGAPTPLELLWNTTPGVRYNLLESPDLETWNQVKGYPKKAASLTNFFRIPADQSGHFYKIEALDEQAPEIRFRFPDDGAFAVKRFQPGAEISVNLADATGVDPESISLSAGTAGTFTTADAQLNYAGNRLTLDLGGDTALGAYGETVDVSLTVADTLGNTATYQWSFELEKEIELADGLFVFGSPAARRAGQRVPPIPTRILSDRAGGGGPVRMNDSEWTLQNVAPDSLVLSYSGTSAPQFSPGQYLTNMTPASVDEIFFRKVTSVTDDPAAKTLTLGTEDVPAWEVVTSGSVSLSQDDIVFETDAEGRIIRAASLSPTRSSDGEYTLAIPPIQVNWEGQTIMGLYEKTDGSTGVSFGLPIDDDPPSGEEWTGKLNLKKALLKISPSISLAVELSLLEGIERFYSQTKNEVDLTLEPEFEISQLGSNPGTKKGKPLFKCRYLIPLGTSPLWVSLTGELRPETSYQATVTGAASVGISGGYTESTTFDYEKDRRPSLKIDDGPGDFHFGLGTPELSVTGTLEASVAIIPELDVKLMSLLGFYININPTLRANATGSIGTDPDTPFKADVGVSFLGNLNAGLSITGIENELLPHFEPWELFAWEERWLFPESLATEPLRILSQPKDQWLALGGTLRLRVQANHDANVSYEWSHNGHRFITDSPELVIRRASAAAAGSYQVTLRYGSESVVSEAATVRIGAPSVPAGFAWIPAGTFMMGTPPNTREVDVDSYFIGAYEVTVDQMIDVLNWAFSRHKVFLEQNWHTGRYSVKNSSGRTKDLVALGSGYQISWNADEKRFEPNPAKSSGYPCIWVSWEGAAAYCNYLSEMRGLEPCYDFEWPYWYCDTSANGYRLPKEAEWEKAARGGKKGKRFPWGDTIDHSRANYYSAGHQYYPYDVNPVEGYHPVWSADGVKPYLAPPGRFPPNDYGIYDMSGNVPEWCDGKYFGDYSVSRPHRGGGWNGYSKDCQVALLNSSGSADNPISCQIGFRVVHNADLSN